MEESTTTATTLRLQGNHLIPTDGPFAETKEQLGGFYAVQCQDLDEAIVWAGKCPGIQHGAIEIRPIVDHEG